jgi:hypothetical protein
MILKSAYQQILIVVDRDELAQMLLPEPGFEIEKIEDKQKEVHFIFGRKTDIDMSLSCPTKKDGSSTVNRGHEHHRSTRSCKAREGRPHRLGGVQRGGGT